MPRPTPLAPVLALLAALALPAALAYRATVVIGEVAQRDSSRLTYHIHMPLLGAAAPEAAAPTSADMRSTQVVTSLGQTLNCLLPPLASEGMLDEDSATVAGMSDDELLDAMDRQLASYADKCYVRKEDWWTYEFCFGRHVVQKHVIPTDRDPQPGEVEDHYLMGAFNGSADAARRPSVATALRRTGMYTQLFTDGTTCETTNHPRRVLVKFVCCDDAVQLGGSTASAARGKRRPDASRAAGRLDFLKAVREVESCVYEIEFMNSAVCQHPAYRAKVARAERAIHCAVADDAPFAGLHDPDYEPAVLAL